MQLNKAMYQIYIVNAFNFGVGHHRQSQCQIYRVLSTYGWWQYVQKGFFGLFFVLFCFFTDIYYFYISMLIVLLLFFTGVSNIVLHKVFSWLIFI